MMRDGGLGRAHFGDAASLRATQGIVEIGGALRNECSASCCIGASTHQPQLAPAAGPEKRYFRWVRLAPVVFRSTLKLRR